jgi:hypothetical protein
VDRARKPGRPGGTTQQPDAVEATRRSGPLTDIACRSRATGQEAEYLTEAAARLEAVTSVLAGAALGHLGAGDLAESVTPLIAVLDAAARFVALAGDQ